MAYTKTAWVDQDVQAEGTPDVDAANLNKLEQGVEDAHVNLAEHVADKANPHEITLEQIGALSDAYIPQWDDIEGKPSSYPSTWTQVSGKPTSYPSSWAEVVNKPATYPPSPHTHDYAPSSHVGSGGAAHANATTSAAGFFTPAEKSKLAAIPGLDNTYRCELTRSANQSTNNNEWTVVTWETGTVNPRNWWTLAQPTRITPGAAGVYIVQLYTVWQASANGKRDQVIRVNGSDLSPRNYADPRVNANAAMSSTYLVNLTNATDYIELVGRQDSGGALNILSGVTVAIARIL